MQNSASAPGRQRCPAFAMVGAGRDQDAASGEGAADFGSSAFRLEPEEVWARSAISGNRKGGRGIFDCWRLNPVGLICRSPGLGVWNDRFWIKTESEGCGKTREKPC